MDLVSNDFLAGLRDFNPQSYVNRRETVMSLTLTPFVNNAYYAIFIELVGDRTTILIAVFLTLHFALILRSE